MMTMGYRIPADVEGAALDFMRGRRFTLTELTARLVDLLPADAVAERPKLPETAASRLVQRERIAGNVHATGGAMLPVWPPVWEWKGE